MSLFLTYHVTQAQVYFFFFPVTNMGVLHSGELPVPLLLIT